MLCAYFVSYAVYEMLKEVKETMEWLRPSRTK